MTTPQTRVRLSSASASGEAAMTASDLLSEMQFPHTRGSGYHQITAVHNGMEVGWLRWNDGSPSDQHAQGEITALGVAKDYQGHGVATRMYREAAQISPVVHSQARTRAGEGWAGSVGGPMRPLREEGYLADMAPPPVSPVGRVVREALEAGRGAASGRNAAGSAIRYLVLPIEAVARMQSGDFGVSMSEILPNGYITPGSFTNDRRYRVSELADDIRRNGVERPLGIYMGRTRPVVHVAGAGGDPLLRPRGTRRLAVRADAEDRRRGRRHRRGHRLPPRAGAGPFRHARGSRPAPGRGGISGTRPFQGRLPPPRTHAGIPPARPPRQSGTAPRRGRDQGTVSMLISPWHRTNRRDGASAAHQGLQPGMRRARAHARRDVPANDHAIRGARP